MPPRRKFDKKNATTFSVVHRAHDDELYFDNDASRHVLVPIGKKGYTKDQLESTLGEEAKKVRNNEGMAAQYGIYYDDSKYDYMQHLRPMGETGDAVFIAKKEDKKEKKADLMELLKDQLPSEKQKKITQEDLENIPKELKGFNPDMDPRLREAMEALEDEAYIEDQEDDLFNELLQGGEAGDDDFYDEEYDEWDMDNYQDEYEQYEGENHDYESDYETQENPYNEGEAPELVDDVAINTAWEKDFDKFKNNFKNEDDSDNFDSEDDFEEERDVLPDLPAVAKKSKTKQRKKKGAMTDTSSFSMSSSAVYRTEGLTLLDDRFEQLTKKWEAEEEEIPEYKEFSMEDERGDFEDLLDDFLDNYELEKGGRKLMKKNEELKKIQQASDSASNTKLAARRKLNADFNKLSLN
ncbi:protein Ltv1p [[Candida] jaroonii]|uniref:Protein Ltv1p n=1 Tax=[Candida] jaroonii TaxID=467808 RepID=A0ACA9Y711_9ASCO|nr:protein Ltv1p [[Candida] jaroonii]